MIHKHLYGIAIFRTVIDEGSFRGAAKAVGLTNSVVSHHVAKLEEALGVTLLYRSTRKLSLTHQGQILYDAARQALMTTEQALDSISGEMEHPVGALRITMPGFMPEPAFEKSILDFASRYPGMALSLHYLDRPADLIAEGYDLGFRVGALPDSSLKAKKLREVPRKLVAAPELFAGQQVPKTPDDLKELDFIALAGTPENVTLRKGKRVIEIVPERHRIEVNTIYAALPAARAGLGLIRLPLPMCEEDLKVGRLIEVLPDWPPPTIPLYAVWPGDARRNSLTRRLLDFIENER